MNDPKFQIGAAVIYQDYPATVTRIGLLDPPDGEQRLLGYELTYADGQFEGWIPEIDIAPASKG